MNSSDLGILGPLAAALGLFVDGSPNGDWFAKPQDYLKKILSSHDQRQALMEFIDDALGGEQRQTENGVIWLPLVTVPLPDNFGTLALSMTVDEGQSDGLHIGVGLKFHSNNPGSDTTLAVPLFRAAKDTATGPLGPTVLLGSVGGRIRLGTHITIDASAPVPGQARLGGIGLQVDVPTHGSDPHGPVFGLSLSGLQLPGAATPRDIDVRADGLGMLDDALLDLVLSLVRAQADAALPTTPIGALGGLLGLRSGDDVPDFPIMQLAQQGPVAIAHWLQGIVENTTQRGQWIGYVAHLLGVSAVNGEIPLTLGSSTPKATLSLGLNVRQGSTGHSLLAPYAKVKLGDDQTSLNAQAELMQVDLVTGQASAFPSLGLWLATGRDVNGSRALDVSAPLVAKAATLRVGFELNALRQLNFVLAADTVTLGTHSYPTLDLSSPNAVMDAVGSTVEQLANQLLGGLGDALGTIRLLLGLDAPAGVTAISLSEVMTDPLAAVRGYWQRLAANTVAMRQVLNTLRNALADLTQAAAVVQGDGTPALPFRLALIGPLALEVFVDNAVLNVSVAVATSVDTLGQRCTVVSTTLRATLAQVDLQHGGAQWLPLVQARLGARERGANPPCARLVIDASTELLADEVALALQWRAAGAQRGFAVQVDAPNTRLRLGDVQIPLALPQFAPDGSVSLPPEAWDGVQALVGYLARVAAPAAGRSVLSDLMQLLGWVNPPGVQPSGKTGAGPALRLAELVQHPDNAISAWLPRLLASAQGVRLLELLADVLLGQGDAQGLLQGLGQPDEPYRLALPGNLPQPILSFGPQGPRTLLLAAPQTLRQWRPGDTALSSVVLEAALLAEARVDTAVADLMRGRSTADGRERADGGPLTWALDALATRWAGGDGLIVPPAVAPTGITVQNVGLAARQLWPALDWDDWAGITPATTVHVAVGASAAACWPDAPAERLIDLTTAGLQAAMFNLPAALTSATGDWYVALSTRANSLVTGATPGSDGTAEQAARLLRVLQALPAAAHAGVVALGGAGHAARLACDTATAVDELLLLGTPLSTVSLSAVDTQPTADAWRLLSTLLPEAASAAAVAADESLADDVDLALGRALIQSWRHVAATPGASADLGLPAATLPTPRAGLHVTACFGTLSRAQVQQAITAVVAAALAQRAQARVQAAASVDTAALGALGAALPSVQAGWRWTLPVSTSGSLRIDGHVDWYGLHCGLTDGGAGVTRQPTLRVRLFVHDASGWLLATPDASLRAVSLDLRLTLDGSSLGTASVVLHEGQVFGQTWESLRLGDPAQWGSAAQALLPEARVLLAAAFQRVAQDVGSGASVALGDVLQALGLADSHGALVGDALDQFLREPATRVRQALTQAASELPDALRAMLGPLGAAIHFAHEAGQSGYTVSLSGGGSTAGRFGWTLDLQLGTGGVSGTVKIGPDPDTAVLGGLQLALTFASSGTPLRAELTWAHAGGARDVAAVWPAPDAAALVRMFTHAVPSLAAQAALELLRRADESARPIIDALLDTLGLLKGEAGDAQRALRPLAGLLRDPVGWFRHTDVALFQATKVQGLLDALRPLMGLPGAPGSPLALATGLRLAVEGLGLGCRLSLQVDPTLWEPVSATQIRLGAGLSVQLALLPDAPPAVGLEAYVGPPQAVPGDAGKQAVHVRVSTTPGEPVQIFLRPSTGADITLVPFSGLGALGSAAQAALPTLLDLLAAQAAPVGPVVVAVGDALALRSGAPAKFSASALQLWGGNPTQALLNALPGLASAGLNALVSALSPVLGPLNVTVANVSGQLKVGVGKFSLAFTPATTAVRIEVDALAVPGIQTLSAALEVSPAGLQDIALTVGPASIQIGTITLQPFVQFEAGSSVAQGPKVAVGMASSTTQRFALRWLIGANDVCLVASTGDIDLAAENPDPVQAALQVLNVLAELALSVALQQAAVQTLLGTSIGSAGKKVRNLLQGVLLAGGASDAPLPGVFDTTTASRRVQTLLCNIAQANIGIAIPGTGLTVSLAQVGSTLGLQLGLSDRFALVTGDVMLWLENDGTWISSGGNSGGLFVGFLPASAIGSGVISFEPSLAVNGLGLRIGKSSGPLLDAGLSIESIALHLCASADKTGFTGGGVHLEFTNLAVPVNGGGGSNGMAQGMLRDSGPKPPKPAFSPGIAVQKHGAGSVEVSLRAGPPPGPWWIAIQRGFGPLYLEQVGFSAPVVGGKLQSVGLLMDGSVSLFGLTCAVDDLQISYLLPAGGGKADFFAPQNWHVDLAGLAVSANMAGVSLAGGMLKQISFPGTPQESVEYLGMLLGRFGVYGLSVYGGFGEGHDAAGHKFSAFFAAGAVNGPIGGPPAFFLTGIGGGFGINRSLKVPTDLSNFGDYPLIQMLDIAAQPSGNPMDRMRDLAAYFPMKKGHFWFAAGLSFNSFALVDGIAVVGVEVGDGLDLTLLGLARMALPRPQVALVSIELALLVRFSSSEGVLWIQGQLTDNSWLLYSDIKITGGFAYVLWFKGERAGEFVLTLGGYHPHFNRAGYPKVPRLGLRWAIGDYIVIKAETYFALTSEALMAGGAFEASAHFGPAWAEVKFGADGIIYFDPFSYDVSAYARIAAGITLDLWLFTITISISLGASIEVMGPEFRGTCTFEIGPVTITFSFGGSDRAQRVYLSTADFVTKYLEVGSSANTALAHAWVLDKGGLPSNKSADTKNTPDGSSARPFVVTCEFAMSFTSTVPAVDVYVDRALANANFGPRPASGTLAIGPLGSAPIQPRIKLVWLGGATGAAFPMRMVDRPLGAFPKGVWGPAGDPNNRKVPGGDMIAALNEFGLVCEGQISPGGPPIAYARVETGPRKPLPFSRRTIEVNALRSMGQTVSALVSQPTTVAQAYHNAATLMQGVASPTALAALRGERQAPPRLGTLAEGLESPTASVVPDKAERPAAPAFDHFIDAPVTVGLMTVPTSAYHPTVATASHTSVKDALRLRRVAPPTVAAVTAQRSKSVAAKLVLVGDSAGTGRSAATKATVLAARQTPHTAWAQPPQAAVAKPGLDPGRGSAMARFDEGLVAAIGTKADTAAGALLSPGQVAVMQLPNAARDAALDARRPSLRIDQGPARVLLLALGGTLLDDVVAGPGTGRTTVEVPSGTGRIVAIGLGAMPDTVGLAGWHTGSQLPYFGWGCAVASQAMVQSNQTSLKSHAQRGAAGWVSGAELSQGECSVSTRFALAPRCILIALDDPATQGMPVAGRQLLMGLAGARRVKDAQGQDKPAQVLVQGQRSVLAYEVEPELDVQGRPLPCTVTIATEAGWRLAAVMASATLSPQAALAVLAERGFDAALQPLALSGSCALSALLQWQGPLRSPRQRAKSQTAARGHAQPAAARPLRLSPRAKAGTPTTRKGH